MVTCPATLLLLFSDASWQLARGVTVSGSSVVYLEKNELHHEYRWQTVLERERLLQ